MNKELRTEKGKEMISKMLIEDKMSKSSVAEELHISLNLLNKLINEHHINIEATKESELDLEELKRLWYETDYTFSEMAEKLGTNQAKVFRTVKKLELGDRGDIKRDRKQIDITYEQIYDLYVDKQLTYKEIAGLVGASITSIHRRIKEYGIEKEIIRQAV